MNFGFRLAAGQAEPGNAQVVCVDIKDDDTGELTRIVFGRDVARVFVTQLEHVLSAATGLN